jgi:hypothetical protein
MRIRINALFKGQAHGNFFGFYYLTEISLVFVKRTISQKSRIVGISLRVSLRDTYIGFYQWPDLQKFPWFHQRDNYVEICLGFYLRDNLPEFPEAIFFL